MSLFFCISIGFNIHAQNARIESSFDEAWKFHKGDSNGAEQIDFNDKSWRTVDLPHDWSIEELPNQLPGEVVGPFSKQSIGGTATGYTIGGTGWYRKTFNLKQGYPYSQTIISFDGVYMNSEVYVNWTCKLLPDTKLSYIHN